MDTTLLELKESDPEFVANLKTAIRARKKLKSTKPKIVPTLDRLSFEHPVSGMKFQCPLNVQDIQDLLLHSTFAITCYYPRWCKLLRAAKVSSVITVVINDCRKVEMPDAQLLTESFPSMSSVLQEKDWIKYHLKNEASSFIDELKIVRPSLTQWKNLREGLDMDHCHQSVVETVETQALPRRMEKIDIDRLDLLLNFRQMLRFRYPLPLTHGNDSEYTFSLPHYEPVTANSPIFSLDCEMVVSEYHESVAAWIAIVDEDNNVLYNSYIKPSSTVERYLTEITGITSDILEDCKVTLNDVKQKIAEILPPDAILAGHSVNFDLVSLKLYHPYVIDTCLIYNLRGDRNYRPSLKHLSARFLGEVVQAEDGHHNPIEDAVAAMKLIKYKLNNGLLAGDAVIGGYEGTVNDDIETIKNAEEELSKKALYNVGSGVHLDLFNLIKHKRRALYIDHEGKTSVSKDVAVINVQSNRKVASAVSKALKRRTYDFVVCQMYLENDQELSALDRYLLKIFCKVPEDSLFCLVFGPDCSSVDRYQGMMAVSMKSDEIKKPFYVDGVEVPFNYRPKLNLIIDRN